MVRNKRGEIMVDYPTNLIIAVIAAAVALVMYIAFKDTIVNALKSFLDWIRYGI